MRLGLLAYVKFGHAKISMVGCGRVILYMRQLRACSANPASETSTFETASNVTELGLQKCMGSLRLRTGMP